MEHHYLFSIQASTLGILTALLVHVGARADDDFERPPIQYSKAQPNNVVERLKTKIEDKSINLEFTEEHGYLPAILKALDVPQSSQVLVFSKTSLQRNRISPKTPRAIYFNDDVYVGYCQSGQVMEISAADPALGGVFYTVDQGDTTRAKFMRQTDACTLCHASSQTRQVPGHTVRSVFPDHFGEAVLSMGTVRVDQTTPFDRRWGGWYVTGTHGKQTHLGNMTVKPRAGSDMTNREGQNVADLAPYFNKFAYLTPHSDIVALMVLEHQTEAHNAIARATIQTRLAEYNQAILDKELGRAGYYSESTARRIQSVADPLVRYLLFSNEAKVTDKIEGTSTFAADFAKRGPRDSRGRSLRDFDLERRLFKYPCSYLIYSDAFAQMPKAIKDNVYQQMHDVLTGRYYRAGFDHLSTEDRQAILEILRETKMDLPEYWKK